MHELGITQEIVALAVERSGGARITRVVLEIGTCTAVLPEAIEFCFPLCAEDTAAQGATLDIIRIPGRARCQKCGRDVELNQPWDLCACGSAELERRAGDELRIKEIEVA